MPIKRTATKSTEIEKQSKPWLLFPIVALGAEHYAMSLLMMKNIVTHKSHPFCEGHDFICMHSNPRHKTSKGQKEKIRVQVKSRYQSNAGAGCLLKAESLDAFDYLILLRLNLGDYSRGQDGSAGKRDIEFLVLPAEFVRKHHDSTGKLQKLRLRGVPESVLAKYRGDAGLQQIARDLGVDPPLRKLV